VLADAAQQEPTGIPWQVSERGAHHRVWKRTLPEAGPDGVARPMVRAVTELATGLHYRDENHDWADTRELIEAVPGGAAARQGPHKVVFAANCNSQGAVDFQTADRQRLASHLLGLACFDAASGEGVLIAEIKDSVGELVGPNQLLYRDAFDGAGISADLLYTYRRAGFEQDVLLRQAPPGPEQFGLDPGTTRLEVYTEFIEAPCRRSASRCWIRSRTRNCARGWSSPISRTRRCALAA
jgi:hypothetical protein